jgi:hypothetical protein
MTPEEQEERKKRWNELNLNSLEDRKEARRLLNEMEREMDADVAALSTGGLDEYALEVWTLLKEMKAALVAITDALHIIPTTVTREVEIPDLEELWLRQQLSEAFDRMLSYRDRRERPPEDLYKSYCDASYRYEDYMASLSRPLDVPDTVFITEPAEELPRIDPEEARLEEEYLTELGRLAEYYERSSDVDDIREYLKNSAAESEELHKRVRDAADRFNEYKRKKRGF